MSALNNQYARKSNLNLPPCPPPGGGVHGWILASANRCRNAGLSESEACRFIAEQISRPPSPPNEIATAVAKAYSSNQPQAAQWGHTANPHWRPPVPITDIKFDPAKLKRVAEKIARPTNWRHWLWERSPKRPEAMNSFSFLSHLYRPGETVLVFDKMDSKEPFMSVQITNPMDCRVPALLRNGGRHGLGNWFLCNPVDGKRHPNPRAANQPSCRSAESITSCRYAVLESDQAPPDQWLAFAVQMPVRIAAIYTSGGRSIHILIQLDAENKEAWDDMVNPLKRQLKVLGADAGALSAVRLSRLPQCWRPEKNGFQRLLYLHPDPPEVSLIDIPVRISRPTALARWRQLCPKGNSSHEAFT